MYQCYQCALKKASQSLHGMYTALHIEIAFSDEYWAEFPFHLEQVKKKSIIRLFSLAAQGTGTHYIGQRYSSFVVQAGSCIMEGMHADAAGIAA